MFFSQINSLNILSKYRNSFSNVANIRGVLSVQLIAGDGIRFYNASKPTPHIYMAPRNPIKPRLPTSNRPLFPAVKNKEMDAFATVMLIDEVGKNIGTMSWKDAVKVAQERSLLINRVGFNATENAAICRLYSQKQLFEKEKKEKLEKKKNSPKDEKIFKFTSNIDFHDLDIKIDRMKEILSDGHPIRVIVMRKGIRKSYLENPQQEQMDKIVTMLQDVATISKDVKLENINLECRLRPKALKTQPQTPS